MSDLPCDDKSGETFADGEARFKLGDQWYYRGNRSPSWFYVASRADGSCQGGISERVEHGSLCRLLDDIAERLAASLPSAEGRGQPSRADIMGAVARGWCSPNNAGKEVDAELAFAITVQIMALLEPGAGVARNAEGTTTVWGPEKQDYPGGPIYRVGTSNGATLPEQPSAPSYTATQPDFGFDEWIAREFPRANGYEIDLCRTVWIGAMEARSSAPSAIGMNLSTKEK